MVWNAIDAGRSPGTAVSGKDSARFSRPSSLPDRNGPQHAARRCGPGRPTRQQIDQSNAALLELTLGLLLAKGFDGVTIREITQKAGMAKRTVVARYGDKASLCKAALERAIDAWAIPVEQLRKAETDELEPTLRSVARLLAENYMSEQGRMIARITNAEAYRTPELSTYAYERCTQPLVAFMSDLFWRRCAAERDFTDAHDYALSFLSLVGTPSRTAAWGVQLNTEQLERRIDHIVRLFLKGLPR